jgi:hypothetical protein
MAWIKLDGFWVVGVALLLGVALWGWWGLQRKPQREELAVIEDQKTTLLPPVPRGQPGQHLLYRSLRTEADEWQCLALTTPHEGPRFTITEGEMVRQGSRAEVLCGRAGRVLTKEQIAEALGEHAP